MNREAFLFGDRSLFGIYQPANGRVSARRHLVIICNAIFNEYEKTQYVARKVSKDLSASGFDVIRFDYGGQGNSGGDLSKFTWQEDLNKAVQEGLALSGAVNVSLVGLRFGAILAANYPGRIHSLVVWDTMESGRAFLEHFRVVHDSLLNGHFNLSREEREKFKTDELAGFRVNKEWLAELEVLELDWSKVHALRAFAIKSDQPFDPAINEFSGDFHTIEEPFECNWDLPITRLLYAHGVVKSICECLNG